MALTGFHFILIFLCLDIIQTKHFLIETEEGMGWDESLAAEKGHDYQDDGRFVSTALAVLFTLVDSGIHIE